MTRGCCDKGDKCRNAGIDCDHCTRSWDYEEPSDCFEEIVEGEEE